MKVTTSYVGSTYLPNIHLTFYFPIVSLSTSLFKPEASAGAPKSYFPYAYTCKCEHTVSTGLGLL